MESHFITLNNINVDATQCAATRCDTLLQDSPMISTHTNAMFSSSAERADRLVIDVVLSSSVQGRRRRFLTFQTTSSADIFLKKRSKYMHKVKIWVGGVDGNTNKKMCGRADTDKFRTSVLYHSDGFLVEWFLIDIAVSSSNRYNGCLFRCDVCELRYFNNYINRLHNLFYSTGIH